MNKSILLEHFNVTEQDVLSYKEDNIDLIGIDEDRISTLLFIQLTAARKHRILNTYDITSVIRSLERELESVTKKAEQFKDPPLNLFWKVHYYDDHFMLRNIYNEWGLFKKKSIKFNRLIAEVIKEEKEYPSPLGWQGTLSHKFMVEGFENRRKDGLTGEWIIFGKHNDLNYYLGLSQHTKRGKEDQFLYKLLKNFCEYEFPQIFSSDA